MQNQIRGGDKKNGIVEIRVLGFTEMGFCGEVWPSNWEIPEFLGEKTTARPTRLSGGFLTRSGEKSNGRLFVESVMACGLVVMAFEAANGKDVWRYAESDPAHSKLIEDQWHVHARNGWCAGHHEAVP
nr:(RS)-norcoclaurine 6-O-methyltransferase-like [Ipomoea batatas]